MAIYVDKNLTTPNKTCTETFIEYIKIAIEVSNNVYTWADDDFEYFVDILKEYKLPENITDIFETLKNDIKDKPYAVIKYDIIIGRIETGI